MMHPLSESDPGAPGSQDNLALRQDHLDATVYLQICQNNFGSLKDRQELHCPPNGQHHV